jgi:uncharacterized protein
MPTTSTKHAQGTFMWPELGTSDLEGARRFYTALFGWTVQEIPMGEGQMYLIFKLRDQEVGAAYRLVKEQTDVGIPPNWAAYIAVDDCDAAVARIKANGGQVLMGPTDVMGSLGRMAACMDPTGAAFCVWQAKDHIGIRVMEEPGALCWTELMTKDTAKARDFYSSVIGWKTESMPMGPMEYTLWKTADGKNAGGMMGITPEMGPMPAHWMSYFQVADIKATLKRATDMGGSVVVPVQDIPNVGQFAVLHDPQHAHFSLLQSST